jgi:hypothetical protein
MDNQKIIEPNNLLCYSVFSQTPSLQTNYQNEEINYQQRENYKEITLFTGPGNSLTQNHLVFGNLQENEVYEVILRVLNLENHELSTKFTNSSLDLGKKDVFETPPPNKLNLIPRTSTNSQVLCNANLNLHDTLPNPPFTNFNLDNPNFSEEEDNIFDFQHFNYNDVFEPINFSEEEAKEEPSPTKENEFPNEMLGSSKKNPQLPTLNAITKKIRKVKGGNDSDVRKQVLNTMYQRYPRWNLLQSKEPVNSLTKLKKKLSESTITEGLDFLRFYYDNFNETAVNQYCLKNKRRIDNNKLMLKWFQDLKSLIKSYILSNKVWLNMAEKMNEGYDDIKNWALEQALWKGGGDVKKQKPKEQLQCEECKEKSQSLLFMNPECLHRYCEKCSTKICKLNRVIEFCRNSNCYKIIDTNAMTEGLFE